MRRAYTLLYILVATIGCALNGRADVVVNARLDSATIMMGDRTQLHIEILTDGENGNAVNLPPLQVPPQPGYVEYHGIEIYQVQADSADLGNGRISRKYDFSIQAFTPEAYTLPTPGFVASGTTDTVWSKPVVLKVQAVDVSVDGNPDSIMPLNPMYGVVAVKAKWYDWIPGWWPWVLIGILAILVALGVVWYLRAKRQGKTLPFVQPKKQTPPYELAIQRLEQLRTQRMAESGNEKEYYTRLTEILRQYLQGRFGINAMEMTSSQIRQHVNSTPETRLPAKHIDQLLQIADFVKFAKERPLPDDNVRAWNAAMQFVIDTKPQPVPDETAKAKEKKQ